MAYFPNGTSGEILDRQCSECPIGRHDDAPCPVLGIQLAYNYEQCDNGNELARKIMDELIDEKGICQMKPIIEQFACKDPEVVRYPRDVIPSMRKWAEERGLIRKI